VRLQWAPLESADHGAAADIDSLVAGNATLVAAVKASATSVIVALIALIGISRILLGVHYLSDVVGAWAVGITWLGVTTFAFELARSAAGQPVTEPVSEGLEPEARADLKPAQPETSAGSPVRRDRAVREQRQPEQPRPADAGADANGAGGDGAEPGVRPGGVAVLVQPAQDAGRRTGRGKHLTRTGLRAGLPGSNRK
jgi:PAP2 superfamily